MDVAPKVRRVVDVDLLLPFQFTTLRSLLRDCVYGSSLGLDSIAVHVGLSPSALSRMLNDNEDDPRHLPVDLMVRIIEATQDMRPIHWLIAKFLPSEEARTRAAVAQLESLAPQIVAALAVIKHGQA